MLLTHLLLFVKLATINTSMSMHQLMLELQLLSAETVSSSTAACAALRAARS